RPVTPEVAGSSPVARAMFFKSLGRSAGLELLPFQTIVLRSVRLSPVHGLHTAFRFWLSSFPFLQVVPERRPAGAFRVQPSPLAASRIDFATWS
ncbi:hypothetical protein, partial [Bosea sp. (in: a-proteobacteria)]|uniref:hypothetical protein n=1 Tax=Bosea sp. (in: a-proteobacteria) TaxID=1871050 RepID=UPI00333FBD2A